MLFKKECKRCNNMFRPKGRSTKLCDDCYENRMEVRNEKLRQMRRK